MNYFNPNILSKLDNLYIKARFVVEGFIIGMHRSPYHGFSVEFSNHREYKPEDEIKHIDWKLWGRTDKYFIKEYEEETNLRTYILMDKSMSMNYQSESYISKLEYAKVIAASLSYLMIKQKDAVGITTFDSKIDNKTANKSTKSHLKDILHLLEKVTPNQDTNISKILHQYAEKINQRGLIILISDLLDEPKEIINGLNHFRYLGHEVLVIHILDKNEMMLNINNKTNFVDLETKETIKTDPQLIKLDYIKTVKQFIKNYKDKCFRNNIDYIFTMTKEDISNVLFKYLQKRMKAY
tara:strand:+ start:353 stop:1237 length:885 start_codon:yes stop_codon:yes gene_type:complete